MKRLGSSRLQLIVVWTRAFAEGMRNSLFLLPAIYVVGGIALAELLLALDSTAASAQAPALFHTTVDSARSLLGTIAGAVITVTALVISMVVVALQLASSQFSPRVLRTLFRSRFQQSVIGFMVGTFAYCLVVLHAVRAPVPSNGEAVVPGYAIIGALALAIIAAVMILAYVDHSARSMQVGEIIRRITMETIDAIDRLSPHKADDKADAPTRSQEDEQENVPESGEYATDIYTVRARHGGWVQQATSEALFAAVPANTTIWLDTRVGSFVPRGGLLCRAQPQPDNIALVERLLIGAIHLGAMRTMQEDIAFGIRQLTDVALRALSPGVNDPTTAYEVIVHLEDILRALQTHDTPPKVVMDSEGRRVVRLHELSHVDLIDRAFNQIRIAGVSQPAIAIALLNTLGALLTQACEHDDEQAMTALRQQARLTLAGSAAASPLPEDLARVRAAAVRAGFNRASIAKRRNRW